MQYSLYLLLICFIHMLIWIIVFASPFFINNFALINIILIIPLIFIVQSLYNYHPFVINKIIYILNNIDKFSISKYKYTSPNEKIDIEKMSKILNHSYKDTLHAFFIMKDHEHYLIFPYYIDYFKEMFNNSFRNPFDAPGLIIIGLIINIYIYFNNKKIMFII